MLGKDIIIVIVIFVFGCIGYLIYLNSSNEEQREYIASVEQKDEKLPSLDNASCSLNCCGFNTQPLVLDGLNTRELVERIENYTTVYNENGTLARTNYSCGRATFAPGPYTPDDNNVGCPCVDKKTYSLIRTRGVSENSDFDLDKSLLIPTSNLIEKDVKMENKSIFSETRKLQ